MQIQKIKQESMKKAHFMMLQECLDNTQFIKNDFKNILFLGASFYKQEELDVLNSNFPKSKILCVDGFDIPTEDFYDLILAPLRLQYINNLDDHFKLMHERLNNDGVYLASGFNVLSSKDDSIDELKNLIKESSFKINMISFFDLGNLLQKNKFNDKALDREKVSICGNLFEIINLYAQKKTNNKVKIQID